MSSKSTFSNSTSKSYAVALYDLAKENSELEKVEQGLKGLHVLLKENKDFKEMILSPTVKKEDKKNVIFLISEKNNFSQTLKKFLGFVSIKNRLFFLEKIIKSFMNLISNKKGELIAELTSSKNLSNEERQKIQKELSAEFQSPININYKYEPKLIGGLIIQIGSIMVDTSIRTKLKKLEKKLMEL